MNCYYSKFVKVICILLILSSYSLYSQSFEESIKKEFGFWLGGSFPAPGTQMDDILDSSLGLGLFYRLEWPSPFLLETGFSYGNYQSLSTQQLLSIPVYFALCYPIPLFNRFQFLGKLGAGASYIEVRPNNVSGWDPILYGGFEFSILASKRFKVGLRLDGYYIYDSFRKKPEEIDWLLLFPGTYDPRIINSLQYKNGNGALYNFGLMVSFMF
ncbi:MAG: hypothetical protein KatS3mg129_1076 [Leptospiraceae bacterium]|nr:MAG: hypothetical protein KatS3mg129_1076 [Leptospiraceae bacterium]